MRVRWGGRCRTHGSTAPRLLLARRILLASSLLPSPFAPNSRGSMQGMKLSYMSDRHFMKTSTVSCDQMGLRPGISEFVKQLEYTSGGTDLMVMLNASHSDPSIVASTAPASTTMARSGAGAGAAAGAASGAGASRSSCSQCGRGVACGPGECNEATRTWQLSQGSCLHPSHARSPSHTC